MKIFLPLLLTLSASQGAVFPRESAVDSGEAAPGVELTGAWTPGGGVLTSPPPGDGISEEDEDAVAIDCRSSILEGDFRIAGEMTLLEPLDGTRVTFVLGNPQVVFDAGQGAAVKAERKDAVMMAEAQGGKIGETFRSGESFRWEVIRTRNKLAVKIDGRKVLDTVIQPGSLGKVRLLPGRNRIAVAKLEIQGNLGDAVPPHRHPVYPRWACGTGLHFAAGVAVHGTDGAVAGFIGSGDGRRHTRLCTAVFDGRTWEPLSHSLPFALEEGQNSRRGLMSSFALSGSAVGGKLTCLYVMHEQQQQIFSVVSGNSGKTWSEPEEITTAFREPSTTVHLDPAWCVEHGWASGERSLVALVGWTGEKGRRWSLFRGSPDGKTWTGLALPRVPETAGGLRLHTDGRGGLWLGWRKEKGDAEIHFSRDGKSWKRAVGLSKIPLLWRGDKPEMETWDFAVWPGKTAGDPFVIAVSMVEPSPFPEMAGHLLSVRVSGDGGKSWKLGRLAGAVRHRVGMFDVRMRSTAGDHVMAVHTNGEDADLFQMSKAWLDGR